MIAAVGVGAFEVGVFDNGDIGKAGVVDVHPVGRTKRSIKLQHKAHVGQVVDAIQCGDIVSIRPIAHHISHLWQRRRGDDAICTDVAPCAFGSPGSIIRLGQTINRGVQAHITALLFHTGRSFFGQAHKTTGEIAQAFFAAFAPRSAAQLELVPEPHGRNLVGIGAKFASEQRFPDDSVDVLVTQAAKPFGGGAMFKLFPVFDAACAQGKQTQADAIQKWQGFEF